MNNLNKTKSVTCLVSDIIPIEIQDRGEPAQKELNDRTEPEATCPAMPSYLNEVDGVAVYSNLFRFAKELGKQRAFKDCRFGVKKDLSNFGALDSKGNPMPKNYSKYLFVYFPKEVYARGVIGYADVAVGESVMWKFYVQSKSIVHSRMDSYRWQKQLMGSYNIDAAIRTAKTHLREYGVKDILSKSIDELGGRVQKVFHSAKSDRDSTMREMQEALALGGKFIQELTHMVKTGYTFHDQSMGELTNKYLQQVDTEAKEKSRKVIMRLVIVDKVNEQYSVTTASKPLVIGAQEYAFSHHCQEALSEGDTVKYSDSELPSNIRFKLSSLNVLEGSDGMHKYVDGLGSKHSDSVYYIVEDCESE